MKEPRAIDALSDHVPVAPAESHPADLRDSKALRRASHVAVLDAGRFCGLVGIKELTECPPGWIFGDLAAKGSLLRIDAAMPIEGVCAALERAHQDAAAIIDEAGAYLGAVTLNDLHRRLAEHQRAEVALTRDSMLAALKSSVLIAASDLNGTILRVSEPVCNLSGYSREELLGANFRILNSGHHPKEFWAQMWGTITQGGTWRGEVCNRAKDGSLYWVDTTIAPARDEAGEIIGYVAARFDITERKRVQVAAERSAAEVLASKQQLRELIDGCFGFIGLYDLEGTLIEANRAPLEAGGLSREEVIGRPFWEAYWWSFSPEVQATLRDALRRAAAGETVRYETPVRVKGDERIMIDVTFGPLRGPDGRVTGIVGFGVDVTERKRTEQALNESEARAHLLMDSVPAYISYVDASERYVWVNRVYEGWYKRPRAEIIGRSLRELQGDSNYLSMVPHIRLASRGDGVHYENSITDESGRTHWFDTSYVPHATDNGKVLGFFVLVHDITERKNSEHALQKSEARLSEAHRLAGLGAWELDLASQEVWWSPEQYELNGVEPGSPISQPLFLSLIHPEDRAAFEDEFNRLLSEGTVEAAYRIVRPDGAVRHMSGIASVHKDAQGRPVRISGTNRDITDRKRAEDVLRQSEERYRTIVRSAMDALGRLDLQGRLLEVNETYCRMSGYSEQELLAMSISDLEAVETAADTAVHIQKVIAQGADRFESRHRRKDGSTYPVEVSVQFMPGEKGQMIAFTRDITERKRAEDAVRENEARLLEAQRLAQIGSWELDIPTDRLIWSDTVFEIFEIDNRQFAATYEAFIGVVHPDDREMVNLAYTRSVRDRTPYDIVHRLQMPDGRIKHVHERGETFYDEEGRPVRSVVTVQDISERRRIEMERVRAAQRESLATLAGGIAHEFNSTLLAAATYLHAAPSDPSGPDASVAKAAALIQQGQALSASLLELFAGPEQAAPPTLAIGIWLPECIRQLSEILPPGASVTLAPISDVKPVYADPLALEQVLRILIGNAADALGGRGEIRVAAMVAGADDKTGVEIQVIDEGPGIPEADRARVFEPFFTTRSRARRSGLGLSLAARMVEQVGGRLSYEPNTPTGSKFVVRLRVALLEAES